MIDLTFSNVHRLFVLSFMFGRNVPIRFCFSMYCMLLIEIKDFNELIDNKSFFDQPVKKQKIYENLSKRQEKMVYKRKLTKLCVPPK